MAGVSENGRKIGRFLFRLMCTFTFQYIPQVIRTDSKVAICWSIIWVAYFIVFSVIVGLVVNCFPTIILIVLVWRCPFDYYHVCYSMILYGDQNTSTAIPHIVLKEEHIESTANNINDTMTAEAMAKFEFSAKIALLLSSVSSSISYVLFIVALGWLYFRPHVWKIKKSIINSTRSRANNEPTEEPPARTQPLTESLINSTECCLHPFNDDGDGGAEGTENITRQTEEVKPKRDYGSLPQHETGEPRLSQDTNTTTHLKKKEICPYISVLILNISINVFIWVIFLLRNKLFSANETELIYNHSHAYYAKRKIWEIAVVSAYMHSLLCSLTSCCLFSKLAYGVQNKCIGMANYLKDVNMDDNNLGLLKEYVKDFRQTNLHDEQVATVSLDNTSGATPNINVHCDYTPDRVRLLYLQTRDIQFLKTSKKTLKLFELWFFVHWVMYIITTFITFSLFIRAIILKIEATAPSGGINFHKEEIVLLGLYSLSNCILFLYPCFRAAAITESRQALFRKLNKKYLAMEHVSREVNQQFLSYLESQKFAFNLRILCVKVSFGYKVAYLSIAVSIFGILFKLAIY